MTNYDFKHIQKNDPTLNVLIKLYEGLLNQTLAF